MRLSEFRVVNCFGFTDSGWVAFPVGQDLIYVLGKNSSGKSALLTALLALEIGEIPKNNPRFTNFSPTDKQAELRATFGVSDTGLDVERLIAAVVALITQQINIETFKRADGAEAFFEALRSEYRALFDTIALSGTVYVDKFPDGQYVFRSTEQDEGYKTRRQNVQAAIRNLSPGGQLTVANSKHSFSLSPVDVEAQVFRQFPRIRRFSNAFSLTLDLPDRITEQILSSPPDALAAAFFSYLGRDTLKTFFASNDPDVMNQQLAELSGRLRTLCDVTNKDAGGASPEIVSLELISKDGLQLTARTSGQKSFYRHLSENTKFLLAYNIYHSADPIAKGILLFDEPSNGFHSSAIRFLLSFLKSLAAFGNLVIVATHSEHLLDADLLLGVKLMSKDDANTLIVRNHFFDRPLSASDVLALQPISDSIGITYGRVVGNAKEMVIVEGVTDLLYMRRFRALCGIDHDVRIAPLRGDSHFAKMVAFCIGQGVPVKVVCDESNIKRSLMEGFGLNDRHVVAIADIVPSAGGIEDLFEKSDFGKLLALVGHTPEVGFESVNNSRYVRDLPFKRVIASTFYEDRRGLEEIAFSAETIDRFRRLIEFCLSDNWFNL